MRIKVRHLYMAFGVGIAFGFILGIAFKVFSLAGAA